MLRDISKYRTWVLGLILVIASVVGGYGQNLIVNPSFEDEINGWMIPDAQSSWGASSLKPISEKNISHDASGGSIVFYGKDWGRACLFQDIKTSKDGTVKFSCWVKMENFSQDWMARAVLYWIGENNGSKEILARPSEKSSGSWRYIESTVQLPKGVSKLRVSLETSPIYSRGDTKTTGEKNNGVVWFDEVNLAYLSDDQIKEEASSENIIQVAYPYGPTLGIYYPKEKIQIAVILKKDAGLDFKFEYLIQDYYGKNIGEFKDQVTKETAPNKAYLLTMPNPKEVGYYVISVKVRDTKGNLLGWENTGYAIVNPVPNEDRDFFFSFSGFRNLPWMVEATKRLGAGSNMLFTTWAKTEPKKGEYDFSAIENWLKLNEESGLKCMILDDSIASLEERPWIIPGWEKERLKAKFQNQKWQYDKEHFEAFSQRVQSMVSKLGKRVSAWVLYQETSSNMRELDHVLHYYTEITKAFSKGARSVDPKTIVAGVGVSGREQTEGFKVSRILWSNLHDDLDIFTPHNYSLARVIRSGFRIQPPEDFLPDSIKGSLDVIRPYESKVLGNDENGYSMANGVHLGSALHKTFVNLTARTMIIHRAEPKMKYYCYFTLEPITEDGGYSSYGLFEDKVRCRTSDPSKGLKEGDPLWPRPAVMAYSTVARFLGQVMENTRIDLHQDIWAYGFKTRKQSVFPIWTTLDDSVSISFKSQEPLDLYNLMGQKVKSFSPGLVQLSLSQEPLWIVGAADHYESILYNIQSSQNSLLTLDVAATILSGNKARIVFKSLQKSLINISYKIIVNGIPNPSEQSVVLRPLETKEEIFTFDVKDEIKQAILLVTADNGKTVSVNIPVARRLIPHVKDQPKWDEKGVGLGNLLLVDLNNINYLTPPAGDLKVANLWKDGECQVKFYLGWDEKNLYIIGSVDNVVPNQAAPTPKEIWKQDCIGIAIDCGNNALPLSFRKDKNGGYDGDDMELFVSLTNKGPIAYTFRKQDNLEAKDTLEYKAQRMEGNRSVYQIAIPWEHLSPLKPQVGEVFKMNLLYSHAAKPDSTLTYWFGLTPGIHGGSKDPFKFESFILAR